MNIASRIRNLWVNLESRRRAVRNDLAAVRTTLVAAGRLDTDQSIIESVRWLTTTLDQAQNEICDIDYVAAAALHAIGHDLASVDGRWPPALERVRELAEHTKKLHDGAADLERHKLWLEAAKTCLFCVRCNLEAAGVEAATIPEDRIAIAVLGLGRDRNQLRKKVADLEAEIDRRDAVIAEQNKRHDHDVLMLDNSGARVRAFAADNAAKAEEIVRLHGELAVVTARAGHLAGLASQAVTPDGAFYSELWKGAEIQVNQLQGELIRRSQELHDVKAAHAAAVKAEAVLLVSCQKYRNRLAAIADASAKPVD